MNPALAALVAAVLAPGFPGSSGFPGPGPDLRGALEGLAAPSSDERRAAELWLGRHLAPGDLAVLADAALELGLEARARLAAAIGSDEVHFALAALLASERDPALRTLGEDALRRMIERWWGAVELAPTGRGVVAAALAGHFSDSLVSLAVGSRSLDEELNTVVRHLGIPEGLPMAGPVAVVLDPLLYAAGLREDRASVAGEPVVRAPEQLLFTVLEEHGEVSLQGFAMDGPRTWLHVVHRARAGQERGDELVLAWCRAVLSEPDPALAEGAARALAATAWPAALDWLARRWTEHGDQRALSGLLLAAERGSVAPALARAGSVARLLAAADEALARGGRLDLRFAEEVQRALGAVGGLADGGDLADLVARGFEGASVGSKRLRLGILADLGRLPPSLGEALRARLAAEAEQPALLAVDLVRTLAHCALAEGGPQPFVWSDPGPMFQGGGRSAHAAVHDRWLAQSGAHPPESWRDPDAAGPGAVQRARLAVWWLAVEPSAQAAARHLLGLVEELEGGLAEGQAGDVLAAVARRGERGAVERLFARARERGTGDPTRLERLELLAGVLAPERRAALLAGLLASPEASGGAARVREEDLQLLGVLAALPDDGVGSEARRAFLAYLAETAGDLRRDPPWVPALERSLALLRGADAPQGQRRRVEEEFLTGLRSELRESNHPSALGLRTGRWPRQPWLEPLPLETLEIRLGPPGS